MMIEAFSIDLDIDLRPFSRFLASQGVRHRISEESGKQVLWVESQPVAESVRAAFEQWRAQPELLDEMNRQWEEQAAQSRPVYGFANGLFRQVYTMPITALLTLVCLVVAVVSGFGTRLTGVEFLFYPLLDARGVLPLLSDIDGFTTALRTLGPMFLHFGGLHLIFNLLWLWYFGKQLEPTHPRWLFLLVIALLSFISNTAQYLVLEYNNFGGMSGVVFGLVSYAWVIHNLMPRSQLMINNAMFGGFVAILVLMEVFAGSFIATAAHVGGLVAGLLLGLVVVAYYRGVRHKATISRG